MFYKPYTVAGEKETCVGLPASCVGATSDVAFRHPRWSVLLGVVQPPLSHRASVSNLQPALLEYDSS